MDVDGDRHGGVNTLLGAVGENVVRSDSCREISQATARSSATDQNLPRAGSSCGRLYAANTCGLNWPRPTAPAVPRYLGGGVAAERLEGAAPAGDPGRMRSEARRDAEDVTHRGLAIQAEVDEARNLVDTGRGERVDDRPARTRRADDRPIGNVALVRALEQHAPVLFRQPGEVGVQADALGRPLKQIDRGTEVSAERLFGLRLRPLAVLAEKRVDEHGHACPRRIVTGLTIRFPVHTDAPRQIFDRLIDQVGENARADAPARAYVSGLPSVVTQIGMSGRVGSGNSRSRTSVPATPAAEISSPRHSRRTVSMPSKVTSERRSKAPGARTKSSACQPDANDTPARPCDRLSTSAHSSATRIGWWRGERRCRRGCRSAASRAQAPTPAPRDSGRSRRTSESAAREARRPRAHVRRQTVPRQTTNRPRHGDDSAA